MLAESEFRWRLIGYFIQCACMALDTPFLLRLHTASLPVQDRWRLVQQGGSLPFYISAWPSPVRVLWKPLNFT